MGSMVEYVIEESSRKWELRDLRTDGWPLAHAPTTPMLMSFTYILMVKVWGPKFMETRKPFELKVVLIVYNAFQIVFNGWMFWESCRLTWFNGYNLICQPVDYSQNEDALRIVFIGYCFYISKLIDFLDTLFFILRKKDNQITFLHVFHHSFMPLSVWLTFRYIAGGNSSFLVTCNSAVHVVMYFYYMIAAMGPRFQKHLWWKKYVTMFQMVQFVLMGLHSMPLFFIDCDFPKAYAWSTTTQAVFFFFLFKNYHSSAYNKYPIRISTSATSASLGVTMKKHM